MKVFVTGHRGYVGAHLIQLLKEEGHFVAGCDLNLYQESSFERPISIDHELSIDIRKLEPSHLAGFDCVVHLAAVSNDPMGELNPDVTRSINRDGSVHLASIAKKAGISRFLFASSCSIYGKGSSLDVDEGASLAPQSVYAASKIEAESGILQLADSSFTVACLRFATAYGYSPMLRLDLVVNYFMASAYSRGDIRITSDGTPWRPLIHVKDMARALILFMKAPSSKIQGKSVNIGSNTENYQVKEIASKVQIFYPEAPIIFTGESKGDLRDYRVNFNLLKNLFPTFQLEYTLEQGMRHLYDKLEAKRLSKEDFEEGKFFRLPIFKKKSLHFESV